MYVERQPSPIEAIYPAFALAQSRASELWEMTTFKKSPDIALERAENFAVLLGDICETWDKLREADQDIPAETLLQAETTNVIRWSIVNLYMSASKKFSTKRSPDYYWPVTWEGTEENTRKISEIIGFWIENTEPVTARKAHEDLLLMMGAWYESWRQHSAWKASRNFLRLKSATPELVGAKLYRERFGPGWGKRARGRS